MKVKNLITALMALDQELDLHAWTPGDSDVHAFTPNLRLFAQFIAAESDPLQPYYCIEGIVFAPPERREILTLELDSVRLKEVRR
jgi:hypothetical protein